MNTGMGDAVNLAWKLAAVLQQRAHPRLLDSYEPERIAFAHLLINTTDKAFKALTSTSPIAGFVRRFVMPKFMAAAMKTTVGGHTFFRMVSQIAIQYRQSPISAGRAAKLRGGDRLPYLAAGDGDNYAPLASLDWQLHVFGKAKRSLLKSMAMRGVPVHEFEWSEAARKAGFVRDGAYLVRPDGHIAVASPTQDLRALAKYLVSWAIKPREIARGSYATSAENRAAACKTHALNVAAFPGS
jgi:hypothetical protein